MVEQVQRELYPERHFLCVFNTLVMMTMRIIMMIMMLLLVMNQCFEKSPGIQLEVGSLVLVEAAVRMVEGQMRRAAFLNLTQDAAHPAMALNSRFIIHLKDGEKRLNESI